MIEISEPASPAQFAERLEHECARAPLIGAYADADAAHYLFLGAHGPYALSRPFAGERRLRALSATRPVVSWDEREMAQDFAVAFDGLPDARPIRLADGAMPEAMVAHGAGIVRFVVGPVHAGIIEPGRFTISSGGETIAHLDAQLGYEHRNVEGALRGRSAVAAAAGVARICGGCSAAHGLAYAIALERLAGVRLASDVELARLLLAELERISNHLADLAVSASGAGYGVGLARGMALKERAMRLCDAIAGHRLLFDAIVPGGVGRMPAELRPDLAREVAVLERDVARYLDGLFNNASLVSRWRGAGHVSHGTATAFGAVGPTARAARGTIDLRIVAPYAAYASLPPALARATGGDAFARCDVKRRELTESFRLVRAALHELGDVTIAAPRSLEPEAGLAIVAVEGPRGAEIVCVRIGERGEIERFHLISASYRNWPVVARAMEGNIVPDFPLVNKSFNLCYACADR